MSHGTELWNWSCRCWAFFILFLKYEVFLSTALWPFSPSLQRQVAGQVQAQPQDRTVNQIAMMLAIMGLSLSYYSAKQMTEKVNAQPAPWRGSTAGAIRQNNGWTNDKWWRWSEEVEVETQQCFWGPNFSHLTVIITLWISTCKTFWPGTECFLLFLLPGLSGFIGMGHSGSCLDSFL